MPLEIKPINEYADRGYPTHSVLDEHPELLALVPRRWRANQRVLTALAGFALLATGSARSQDRYNDHQVILGDVAPPQVTLTEQEAREVIVNEAKLHGISFKADTHTAKLSVDLSKCLPEGDRTKPKKLSVKLFIDGTDRKHNVEYEYISEQDITEWQRKCPELKNIPKAESSKPLADSVKSALDKSNPKVKHAVFTSPVSFDKDNAKKELQRQVEEFMKWLKGQGVI